MMDSNLEQLINQFKPSPKTLEFIQSNHGPYINSKAITDSVEDHSEIIEPSTGLVLTKVRQASRKDVDNAVVAAGDALTSTAWAGLKPNEREELMRRVADLMARDAQILAEIEALNAGKAISGCMAVDVQDSITHLRYMAGWASKIEGSTREVSAQGKHLAFTRKEPVGVVGAIVPWNWPLSMGIWKIAAPLAAGCTVVLKPSELTPLSMLYIALLCREAGIPEGVINIVTGPGRTVGQQLTQHPDIHKISFTGSTEVGMQVGSQAMQNVTNVTLELGGKSPMIVFADADIENVVDATQRSVFFNSGQVCSAGSRMYLHKDIYSETIDRMAVAAQSMKQGFTLDPTVEVGPLISDKQQMSVLDYIDSGSRQGARLVCGGAKGNEDGFFVQPTIFADCHNKMKIVQEEIFGPVLSIIPFDEKSDVIKMANDNIFGLAASVFSQDISRAMELLPLIEAGTVWVNTHDYIDPSLPFGGYKKSGIGKDLGPEQLEHFLNTKTVWIKIRK